MPNDEAPSPYEAPVLNPDEPPRAYDDPRSRAAPELYDDDDAAQLASESPPYANDSMATTGRAAAYETLEPKPYWTADEAATP